MKREDGLMVCRASRGARMQRLAEEERGRTTANESEAGNGSERGILGSANEPVMLYNFFSIESFLPYFLGYFNASRKVSLCRFLQQ